MAKSPTQQAGAVPDPEWLDRLRRVHDVLVSSDSLRARQMSGEIIPAAEELEHRRRVLEVYEDAVADAATGITYADIDQARTAVAELEGPK